MKPVLLLFPPYEGRSYLKSRPPFPLGLLYIGAYLKKHGIKNEIIDMSYPPQRHKTIKPIQLTARTVYSRWGWSDSEIRSWLHDNLQNYHNVVGVSSLMSSNWTGAYRLIKIIKEISPSTIIAIGGPHATMYPQHVQDNSNADIIFLGESEESFYRYLIGDSPKAKIYPCKLIEDLDSLPFIEKSQLSDYSMKEMYITFSRGCPHQCSFCVSHLIQGRIWRYKSIEHCLREIKHYINTWGISKFIVEDDNPCPDKRGMEHLRELCHLIISSKLKIRLHISHGLPVYMTAKREDCELLWKAGFRKMTFPLESTDPAVTKDMNKMFAPELWLEATKNWTFEKHKPTEIILGYPFVETIQTMLKTMLDVYKNKCLIWASYFRLYKGTTLYERCIKAGYVKPNYDPINTQSFYIATERFSIEDLQELMRICQGLNFLIECNGNFPFKIPKRMGDVVSTGNFKFRHGQNIAAAILLISKQKILGKPMITYENEGLIYRGFVKNDVWRQLSAMGVPKLG